MGIEVSCCGDRARDFTPPINMERSHNPADEMPVGPSRRFLPEGPLSSRRTHYPEHLSSPPEGYGDTRDHHSASHNSVSKQQKHDNSPFAGRGIQLDKPLEQRNRDVHGHRQEKVEEKPSQRSFGVTDNVVRTVAIETKPVDPSGAGAAAGAAPLSISATPSLPVTVSVPSSTPAGASVAFVVVTVGGPAPVNPVTVAPIPVTSVVPTSSQPANISQITLPPPQPASAPPPSVPPIAQSTLSHNSSPAAAPTPSAAPMPATAPAPTPTPTPAAEATSNTPIVSSLSVIAVEPAAHISPSPAEEFRDMQELNPGAPQYISAELSLIPSTEQFMQAAQLISVPTDLSDITAFTNGNDQGDSLDFLPANSEVSYDFGDSDPFNSENGIVYEAPDDDDSLPTTGEQSPIFEQNPSLFPTNPYMPIESAILPGNLPTIKESNDEDMPFDSPRYPTAPPASYFIPETMKYAYGQDTIYGLSRLEVRSALVH